MNADIQPGKRLYAQNKKECEGDGTSGEIGYWRAVVLDRRSGGRGLPPSKSRRRHEKFMGSQREAAVGSVVGRAMAAIRGA